MPGNNFNTAVAFFERNDFKFQIHRAKSVVHMSVTGKNGTWAVFVRCDDQADRFSIHSSAPVRVPEAKRQAVAEYLTRANWGMSIGNFELDFSDGEVRYKTSMDIDGIDLNENLIGMTFAVNNMSMDRYLPGLMAVIYSDVKPADAVQKVEDTPAMPTSDEIETAVRSLLEGITESDLSDAGKQSQSADNGDSALSHIARLFRRRHGKQ